MKLIANITQEEEDKEEEEEEKLVRVVCRLLHTRRTSTGPQVAARAQWRVPSFEFNRDVQAIGLPGTTQGLHSLDCSICTRLLHRHLLVPDRRFAARRACHLLRCVVQHHRQPE